MTKKISFEGKIILGVIHADHIFKKKLRIVQHADIMRFVLLCVDTDVSVFPNVKKNETLTKQKLLLAYGILFETIILNSCKAA